MRIYFGPGRYFEEVTEMVTPDLWYGFEFRIERPNLPTRRYRVYMDDLEFLPQEVRERVAEAVAGEFASWIQKAELVTRHMNG